MAHDVKQIKGRKNTHYTKIRKNLEDEHFGQKANLYKGRIYNFGRDKYTGAHQ